MEKLEKLMQKWDELRSKELMEAFSRSERSFEEIMRFLSGNEVDDEQPVYDEDISCRQRA